MATNESTNAQLEWIQMKKDFDASQPETAREKMLRKIRDNPFVPLGKFFFQISIFAKVVRIYLLPSSTLFIASQQSFKDIQLKF